MKTYIMRKLLWIPPMLLVISFVSFFPTRLLVSVPDKPSEFEASASYDFEQEYRELQHLLWDGQPVHIHYIRWLGIMKQPDGQFRGVLQGNLGQSIWEDPNEGN
jgi:ABC-type dipeptide/oligopeptide/nickel transport system permease component